MKTIWKTMTNLSFTRIATLMGVSPGALKNWIRGATRLRPTNLLEIKGFLGWHAGATKSKTGLHLLVLGPALCQDHHLLCRLCRDAASELSSMIRTELGASELTSKTFFASNNRNASRTLSASGKSISTTKSGVMTWIVKLFGSGTTCTLVTFL